MPAFRNPSEPRQVAALVLALAGVGFAPSCLAAEAPAAAASAPGVRNSSLDARLFYQLLLGEIELRQGQAGNAYQLMLDAARRTRDEALFRRATDIALTARAGEQALAAATAWREALPESQDAMRYQVQLLLALNRVADTEEPLSALLRVTPRPALPGMIETMPRFLARSADRSAVATLSERVLRPYTEAPETKASALTAIARGWLTAGDTNKALELARAAGAADPAAEAPAFLALDMLPATPAAEEIVTAHLASKPASPNVRLLYVRTLAASQRLVDASAQLAILTQSAPELAPPWLTLGALELELRRPKEATAALQNYVRLVQGGAPVTLGAAGPQGSSGDDDEDTPSSASAALTQAWLLLAQAAEQQQDFVAAEGWLARIDNPRRALEVQARRASLLARQGKVSEARELIRRVPEQSPGDARAKLLAETEILRERKMWTDASQVLAQASRTFPNDTDLLYEEAMLHEKLDRIDEMERLLRRVIELKPDHPHAYNALGYSLADRKLRLPEARALIQKALELSPGEPSITDSLGWVEYRLGNHEEAIRLLRKAYQARPDPEIAAHLGEVLWASGQRDEARKVWREGRLRDAQNDVLRETLARLRVDL
ncbi:MAG TPA: tetratricopeptide repeat protein [Caldimonas sp.]|jgi:tetratricopeptide (TPR) repeat protein|nr:tetratricopeptide repeat protein [Caldimonas sp.]HEX2542964.1 tetratricopeptide repeat protein [Caldimonas sp.]